MTTPLFKWRIYWKLIKCGPRISWDLKTQQTKTFIDCKSEDIIRLLFQSRTNVSVMSTFRFHAISVWKPKTIGRASGHQIPLPSVQRSTVSLYFWCEVSGFSILKDSTFPLQNVLMESERPRWVNMTRAPHQGLGTLCFSSTFATFVV